MAPKLKLTPQVEKLICDAIRAGNYQETAAAYAGISKNTFYEWLKKGRRDKTGRSVFAQFVVAVDKALADAEVRDVATIVSASAEQWQAAAWRLERKYPERWGRKSTVKFDNDKPTNESLTSLINQSMLEDPAFKDVGKGFGNGNGEPDKPSEENGSGSDSSE